MINWKCAAQRAESLFAPIPMPGELGIALPPARSPLKEEAPCQVVKLTPPGTCDLVVDVDVILATGNWTAAVAPVPVPAVVPVPCCWSSLDCRPRQYSNPGRCMLFLPTVQETPDGAACEREKRKLESQRRRTPCAAVGPGLSRSAQVRRPPAGRASRAA